MPMTSTSPRASTATTPDTAAESSRTVLARCGPRVRARREKTTRERADRAQGQRQRADVIATTTAPILAAAGVSDPTAHAHKVDEHLIRLGYLLTYPDRTDPQAAPVDEHARKHCSAMAIDLTVHSATEVQARTPWPSLETGRDWAGCVRDGEQLLDTLAAQGITLTRVGHRQTPAGQSTPTAKSPSKRNRS